MEESTPPANHFLPVHLKDGSSVETLSQRTQYDPQSNNKDGHGREGWPRHPTTPTLCKGSASTVHRNPLAELAEDFLQRRETMSKDRKDI